MIPELETRSCLCGCGATFRVTKQSRNWHASKDHEEWAANRNIAAKIAAAASPGSRIVSTKELSEELGLSLTVIYYHMKRGRISGVPGSTRGKTRWDLEAVRTALNIRKEEKWRSNRLP